MGKKALLIGCNYPGTMAELDGCVNDVKRMKTCLVDRYGFSDNNITVLIDTDHSYKQPTGKNIYEALTCLVQSAEPGDIFFIHYSGHGSRFPLEEGEVDETEFDECLVPCDMNLIFDDDLRDIVDQVPEGCRITIVSDSCHSGGLIDGAKKQIGGIETEKEKEKEINGDVKSRALDISTVTDILSEKTGKGDIDVGKLRCSLFEIFGEEASPKIKKFMKVYNMKKQQQRENGSVYKGLLISSQLPGMMVGRKAQEFLKLKWKLERAENAKLVIFDADQVAYTKQKVDGAAAGAGAGATISIDRPPPKCGILISGCQTDQISADATPSGKNALPFGAFSDAIQAIIAESDNIGLLTNRELVLKAKVLLETKGLAQQPGLFCNDDHVDAPFLC